uniref:Uncharacterized protein n=1 Tax=Tanacetum cinerariifolium TaxID=118510 RepID=A0A699IRN3_TANCI|nr:hypothetical protein [Tanacetum cinerariifolium]
MSTKQNVRSKSGNECNNSGNECNSSKNECSRSGNEKSRSVIESRNPENECINSDNESNNLKNESRKSGNDTNADYVDIRPTYDKEPLEKVHLNDEYDVFSNEKQHIEKLESINDTYVMEKVDSNVTPDSSDMSNNEERLTRMLPNIKKNVLCLLH